MHDVPSMDPSNRISTWKTWSINQITLQTQSTVFLPVVAFPVSNQWSYQSLLDWKQTVQPHGPYWRRMQTCFAIRPVNWLLDDHVASKVYSSWNVSIGRPLVVSGQHLCLNFWKTKNHKKYIFSVGGSSVKPRLTQLKSSFSCLLSAV